MAGELLKRVRCGQRSPIANGPRRGFFGPACQASSCASDATPVPARCATAPGCDATEGNRLHLVDHNLALAARRHVACDVSFAFWERCLAPSLERFVPAAASRLDIKWIKGDGRFSGDVYTDRSARESL